MLDRIVQSLRQEGHARVRRHVDQHIADKRPDARCILTEMPTPDMWDARGAMSAEPFPRAPTATAGSRSCPASRPILNYPPK